MKRIHSILLAAILMAGCSKHQEKPDESIKRIYLYPQIPLIRKNQPFMVTLLYENDYQDKDNITVSFNGQNGTLTGIDTIDSKNIDYLYTFTGVNQSGDGKLKASIKKGKTLIEKEVTYRVVDDYSLKTAWDKLNQAYVIQLGGQAMQMIGNRVVLLNFVNPNPTGARLSGLGSYADDGSPQSLGAHTLPFIDGLQGNYGADYTGDELTELNIDHGSPSLSNFSSQKVFDGLTAAFGPYKSQTKGDYGSISTVYETPDFILTTYLSNDIMRTIIKKK